MVHKGKVTRGRVVRLALVIVTVAHSLDKVVLKFVPSLPVISASRSAR